MTRMPAATIALAAETQPIHPRPPGALMSYPHRSKIDAVLALALMGTFEGHATAEPLRLRGDALVQTQSPVGLVILQGEDRVRPWLDAEAVTWVGMTGAREPTAATGD